MNCNCYASSSLPLNPQYVEFRTINISLVDFSSFDPKWIKKLALEWLEKERRLWSGQRLITLETLSSRYFWDNSTVLSICTGQYVSQQPHVLLDTWKVASVKKEVNCTFYCILTNLHLDSNMWLIGPLLDSARR